MESNNLDKDKNLEVQPESENIENNRSFVGKVIENNVMQLQPTNNIMDLKKKIFDNRKFIRWVSFFSIFSIIMFGLSLLSYCLYIATNDMFFQWVKNHQNWFNAQNSNRKWGGYWYPGYLYDTILNCGWKFFRPFSIVILGFACLFLVISWILNINLLVKFKDFRKLYLPFFIFSFIIPFLTWLYCMGLMAFMKHNNRINYYEWLKEIKIKKYTKYWETKLSKAS